MSSLAPEHRVRVLCVDDEPRVLDGLSLHLERRYDVATATSGSAGLEILAREPAIAVVMSDMRMPGMDGVGFLSRARKLAPDAVRVLLTGQADLNAAINAINDGEIFRFLTKPCAPLILLKAFEAATTQHRLITSERVLLEQTLHGAIKALTDVLALTSPMCFGRATRVKRRVAAIAEKLQLDQRWHLEVAAMLSQLGYVTLPAATMERVYHGHQLTDDERKMVATIPAVTVRLIRGIPRLDEVREILREYSKPFRRGVPSSDPGKRSMTRDAQVLRVALELDQLEAQGMPAQLAIETLRGRDTFDPDILEAQAELHNAHVVKELPVTSLRVGMILAEDIRLTSGTLLVTRGHEITASFIERVRNFPPGMMKELVLVSVSTSSE